jgi:hypothetical protein
MLIEAPFFRNLKRLYVYNAWVTNREAYNESDIGLPFLSEQHRSAAEPLRQALVDRFGSSVVDFTTDTTCLWSKRDWMEETEGN